MTKKNAHPIPQDKAGAAVQADAIVMGRFPARKATVTAEVLSRLLRGHKLTGMDGVFKTHTTRLADVIHRLHRDHRWVIFSEELAVGTKDGRTQTIAVYFLGRSVIAGAEKRGSREFITEVVKARAALRAKAHEAAKRAKLLNLASRKARTLSEGQRLLWGEL